ncbi:MAG: hypothetical protein LQ339_003480 [Xanthoria mediterranea]|nr:MAG: hypothetical protein LQ339_003480 [Xanthoria mediterranea]
MSTPTTTFSLEGRGLKLDTEDDARSHTQGLSSTKTYTHISLSGNTLGAPACTYLAPLLSAQTSLTSINLADIFTSRLLSEIPPALTSLLTSLLPLQNLTTIDLSDNAFGLKTQAPLVDFLRQHVPLQHLILNNNGLGPEAGTHIATALFTLADRKAEARIHAANNATKGTHIPPLETLICGRNRLETGSMAAWAQAFQKHPHLKTVKMVQNGIRQPGIRTLLLDGLNYCRELEVLDLQDNTFTHVGAEALSSSLPLWPHLRELGVGDSLLGRKGGMGMLCAALSQGRNKELRVLRLQYNEIDSRGVARLLRVVEEKEGESKLPCLRRVELNGNKFAEEDEGVARLRRVLEGRRGDDDGEGDGEEFGLDQFSDLEEDSDVEDEEEEEEADDIDSGAEENEKKEDEKEKAKKAEAIVRDAEEEEGRNVSQKQDAEVDVLAEKMGRTEMI